MPSLTLDIFQLADLEIAPSAFKQSIIFPFLPAFQLLREIDND